MAMASGSDPLDRLHTDARELRAERELCHTAADQACRAESGQAFSTVMDRKIDEEAFVIQMDQNLVGTMYFDEALMGSLEAAHQDPTLSADELRKGVIDIVSTTHRLQSLHFSRGAAVSWQSSRNMFWYRWLQPTKRKAK